MCIICFFRPSIPLLPDPPSDPVISAPAENANDGDSKTFNGASNCALNHESVKRVVKTLLGDFKHHSLSLPSSSQISSTVASEQTIPVLVSNQPRPLLPHPPSSTDHDSLKTSDHGEPTKRPKTDKLDG